VIFNDVGRGTVILNTNVGPASVVISNSSKTYTLRGNGSISGPTGLQKLGSGTAILNLTNNSYAGDTTISNGTLQAGSASAISPSANVVIGSSGTLELAGFNQTAGDLTGSGIVDNNSGLDLLLTVGTSSGGTWNGSIQNSGGGGIALIKNGSGTWVVGGANYLNNASPFTTTNEFNAGTTIITNGGSILVARLQTTIPYGSGTATMVVDGGTLAVSNEVLAVGYSTTANGTLIVNSGTVLHGGGPTGSFGSPNNLIIGAAGGTGTLTVNGGQVLNSQALVLGENTGANAQLYLNGGLIQATQVRANGTTPNVSIAWFNGGTLQATASSASFLQVVPMMMAKGLVLDDNGFTLSIAAASLQDPGDGTSGGLLKKGAGTVYLDVGNSYYGTTVVTNGTLAGVGAINGPMIVLLAGNLGAGDAGDVGIFTINNNLTLQGKATLRIKHNSTVGEPLMNDQVDVNGNIIYGGTLTVNNITSDLTPLTTSDTFPLFSVSGSTSGNFTSIVGSPGAGLAYSFNPASGLLSIVASSIASNSTNITFSVSGSTLTLSWPADHLGWILQSQTNSLGVGISTNWADVPGSDSITSTNYTVNPANPTVFYRLRNP
jgi:autotransporter-associated beta strand protein